MSCQYFMLSRFEPAKMFATWMLDKHANLCLAILNDIHVYEEQTERPRPIP